MSTEYLLAKIGVDTAENEPLKVHLIVKLWDLIFTEPPRPGSRPKQAAGRGRQPQADRGSHVGLQWGAAPELAERSRNLRCAERPGRDHLPTD